MRKRSLSLSLLVRGLRHRQPKFTPEKEASIKTDLADQIDAMKKQAQVMVDSVLFGELGSGSSKPRST